MKDLLTIKNLTEMEVLTILNLADNIKKNPNDYSSNLKGKTAILLFQKTSTRTRISFESGMYQLGGNVIYVDWTTTNLHLGSLSDEIKCMSGYVNFLIARVYEHKTLETMQSASSIPIINGLSDLYHPCQALSDLMTIREKFGGLKNIRVSWVGDGNNVCNSLILGCLTMNIPISVATPENYKPHKEVIDWVKINKKDDIFSLTNDPQKAVKEADVIYTDTFVSMGQEAETEKRLKIFKPYQVNTDLISHSNKKPLIMHCLPAHRGVEITDEVLDSKNSIVFEQAENRLHLQKALFLL